MGKFELYVDDNSHPERSEDRPEKIFDTYEEAVAAAKRIIDGFLTGVDHKGMTAEELFSGWSHYGESPYIISNDKEYVERLKAQGAVTLTVIQQRIETYGKFNFDEIFKPIDLPVPEQFSASNYARQRCRVLCHETSVNAQKGV